ncbi:hypothetical protein WM40_06915 [Robbsia andropogonis]|uniref:Uncharacterized protein n=1 Tax=Robbsia andropogonis TaxID=28092 RepID=A0A0F5K2R5_9BURK|nr:type III secretion system chaperone [Robbsia andropogonis]KKB64220.1 hypothetical protein WM40_06915 [Robbsia andropogonis]
MTRYQQLLKDYALLVGLEPAADLVLNQELRALGLSIGLSAEGDKDKGNVVLFTSLGQLDPQLPKDRLLLLMLEANALWAGTGGCTLGVQSGTGAVLLCVRVPLAGCDAGSLAVTIDAFIDVAVLWREIVQGRHTVNLPAINV